MSFCGRPNFSLHPAYGIRRGRAADDLLAPRAEKGGLINSERRKHRNLRHLVVLLEDLSALGVAFVSLVEFARSPRLKKG